MAQETKLVRMYPYSKRNGWVMRSFTLADRKNPKRFRATAGWYEVPATMAAELAKVPQEDRRPKGIKAFVVADDIKQAKEIDAEIAEAMNEKDDEEKGTADAPIRVHKRPGARASAGGTDGEASENGTRGASTGKPRKRSRAMTAGE